MVLEKSLYLSLYLSLRAQVILWFVQFYRYLLLFIMACDHILLSALVSCIMKDKLVLDCKFIFCANILKFDGLKHHCFYHLQVVSWFVEFPHLL